MIRRTVVGVIALLAAGACGGGDPVEDRSPAGEAEGAAALAGAADGPVTRYRGLFTAEAGWAFIPCGEDVEIPAEGPAIPDLLQVYEELVPEGSRDPRLFVDILAELRDDGRQIHVEILEVRRAWHEGTGCGEDETGILLEASGTEPFWNVRVEESVLYWQTPETLRRFTHEGLELNDTGAWVVRGREVEGDATLTVEAWAEPCRNQMSGAFSHLVAEIQVDGRTVQGCAHLGMQVEAAE